MVRQTIAVCLTAAVLGASTGLSADAPAQPSSCAFVRSIDYWKPIDKENAYIYTSPRRKFKVKFFAPCQELNWAVFARLDTRPGGHVCLSPGDALIFGRGTIVPRDRSLGRERFGIEERCVISAIEPVPYDDDEQPKPPG